MKRMLAYLLTAALMIGLCGCSAAALAQEALAAGGGKLSGDPTVEFSPAEPTAQGEETEHGHQLAEEPQTVKDPFVGYCGNTWTRLHIGEKTYEFMFGHSVTLTDILLNLDYRPGEFCRCMAEYTVDTEFGLGYEVNLTEGFARWEKGQASLTAEQVEQIRQIIQWAVTTDCEYPVP